MYKEPKYRTILESTKEELNKLRNISLNDKYKPLFHIHPQHGLLNDPNGLAYYNGKYHVFYQWYPYDATHGMKHWAYVSSDDFVNWNREDVALIPIESYESHGVYSGNAIEVDGKLHMYYTGNIKYSTEDRYAYQNLAIMDKDGKMTKYENNPIVSEIPKGYTGHVRDPKVFKRKDKYFMLLGAQTSDKKGVIIVYESKNSIDWNFKGELNIKNNIDEDFGYMWECPDYINIDGKDVLIFSPQGVEPKGFDYQNIYNVVYAIGNMDLDNLTFQIDIMKEMEKGFDFYAPQTFTKESQIILFAWAGMGEVLYPTDKNKWAHCLTVPRKLNIKNNKLLQMPVDELIKLRYDETIGQNTIKNNINIIENDENVYELNINIKNIDSNKFGLELFSSQDEGVKLEFNKVGNTVTLDRSNFKKVFGVEYGTNRKEYINIDENTNIKVLADRSILEIFINDGEVVFTSRIFAKENSNQIRVYSDKIVEYKYTKFKLKQGIEL
ncbi:glycoside hydrolase family 32 protein [Clostridioides difficile]|uniref:glycoside hydrolase family 32 protein n=6 Tax=Clostridioides difficile TaxID=1496 RepID=UPI000CF1D6CE|nr:sucrose-6-phosphate hydrolase [Clostridioides difficile]PPV29432.1 glycosyl hydrolase family 32 [Clostridioides difficile]